jgi:putative ABC transport system permease protein
MIIVNLKTAFRQLFKNKAFSFINIIGLSFGVAACLFILQYVVFELSYDRFHKDADRIYRVANDRYQNGELIQHGTITYPTIGPALKEDYEEVEAYTRVVPGGRNMLRIDDRIFVEGAFMNVDHNFLTVFTFDILAGNLRNCLSDPWTMVLTKKLADKYYGEQADYTNVLGKLIYIGDEKTPYKVTGVIEDVPENSHVQFNFLISYSTLMLTWGEGTDNSWTWSDFWHYVKLKPGVDYKQFQLKFSDFSQRHFKGNLVSGSDEVFFLQPLTKAHLYSDFEYEIGKVGNAEVVWASLILAILVLVIAWINYINLSTARAIERSKEVGIRKTLGAFKYQLIYQFMLESALFNVLGILLALIIVQLAQPFFNEMLNVQLSLGSLLQNDLGGSIVLLFLGAGLIAGIVLSGFYPAFILSSYQPIKVLKGKLSATGQGAWLRQALVVFQFTAAIIFITVTFAVYRQIRYMGEKDLGMNIHQTVCIWGPELTPWDSTFIERTSSFVNDVENLPNVKNATTSFNLPGDRLGRIFDVQLVPDTIDQHYTTSQMRIGLKFIENYGITLLAGRAFIFSDYNADPQKIQSIIINESTLKLLGLRDPQEALGRTLKFYDRTWNIIGVIADFHHHSLKLPIESIIFLPFQSNGQFISVKVQKENLTETLAGIKEQYLSYFPNNNFDYFFLDEHFNKQYANEQLFGKVAGSITLLAISVACLGLFGLVLFTALQRKKEVGIRRVLGATIQNLVVMMSKNFVKLILISFIIGLPLSYFSIRSWLANYSYRITMDWIMFALPCISLLVIAVIIMSAQTLKTASINPVDSLRNE